MTNDPEVERKMMTLGRIIHGHVVEQNPDTEARETALRCIDPYCAVFCTCGPEHDWSCFKQHKHERRQAFPDSRYKRKEPQ